MSYPHPKLPPLFLDLLLSSHRVLLCIPTQRFSPGTLSFSIQHEFCGSISEPTLSIPLTPHFLCTHLARLHPWIVLLGALLLPNSSSRAHAEESTISTPMGITTNWHASVSAGRWEPAVSPSHLLGSTFSRSLRWIAFTCPLQLLFSYFSSLCKSKILTHGFQGRLKLISASH